MGVIPTEFKLPAPLVPPLNKLSLKLSLDPPQTLLGGNALTLASVSALLLLLILLLLANVIILALSTPGGGCNPVPPTPAIGVVALGVLTIGVCEEEAGKGVLYMTGGSEGEWWCEGWGL